MMLASVWSDAKDGYQPPITQTNSDDKQRPAARPPQKSVCLVCLCVWPVCCWRFLFLLVTVPRHCAQRLGPETCLGAR